MVYTVYMLQLAHTRCIKAAVVGHGGSDGGYFMAMVATGSLDNATAKLAGCLWGQLPSSLAPALAILFGSISANWEDSRKGPALLQGSRDGGQNKRVTADWTRADRAKQGFDF